MKYNLVALVCGIIFGMGLTISKLINPTKIQGFLDITGLWDPSLAFVMISALLVTWLGYRFIKKTPRPVCTDQFHLPEKKSIDRKLIVGSAIFGVGWGLAGYCPGPGITALGLGILDAVYFVIGMVASSLVYRLIDSK